VQLVAPCVQIHRRIENSVRRAENQAAVIEAVRHAEARSETQLRGILQAARHSLLTANEATNWPFSCMMLLQLRWMSTSGVSNSYRTPASIVVEDVARQVSWAKASADQLLRFMLGTPACNCVTRDRQAGNSPMRNRCRRWSMFPW